MDVWDDDTGINADDEIDQFAIEIPDTVSNINQLHSNIAQGRNGIGILTFSYFNISSDPVTSCSLVGPSVVSTPSQTLCSSLNGLI